ncbi:MAG: hypothetical protein AABX25_01535 [Nanoarchaeota archaeon]
MSKAQRRFTKILRKEAIANFLKQKRKANLSIVNSHQSETWWLLAGVAA